MPRCARQRSSGRCTRVPIGRPSGPGSASSRSASSSRRRLVVGRIDHALRLAAADVQAQAAVVAALTPGARAAPVDGCVAERGRAVRRLAQHEIALVAQPLVDADRALHRPRAVIGDHHHGGVVVEALEELADLVVEVLVVAPDHVAIPVPRLVPRVRGVDVAPERVVEPVEADLDHHEEVPRPGVEQVAAHREALLGHRVDLGEDPVAVVAAEVAHVDAVGPDEALDLVAQLRRMRVRVGAGVRRQEARDELAVDGDGRRRLRDAEHDDVLAGASEVVPDAVASAPRANPRPSSAS